MHAGKIATTDTAAGRVYHYLKGLDGQWVDGWTLALSTRTTAVSTRVSEIRHQLTDERIEVKFERKGWWYRLVSA